MSVEDRLYRRLKGVRKRLRVSVDKALKALEEGDLEAFKDFEAEVKSLAASKTQMRKEFERRTGIKGPYRLRR